MKFFALIILLFCFSPIFGQKSQSLKAYLDHKNFYNPEAGNFVEIHLQFIAYTLKFEGMEGGLQSEIAIQYKFMQDGKLVKSDAYRLQSPVMKDSIIEDFFEIKRISLEPGKYTLELSLTDLKREGSIITALQNIEVTDLKGQVALSSLQTAEIMYETQKENVFSKSGYDIVPRISNYYSNQANNLPVYFEIYAPSEEQASENHDKIGLKQTIIDTKTKKEIEQFTRFTLHNTTAVQPIIRKIDISNLKSGEYILEYSLLSRENIVLYTSNYYFERFKEEEYQPISSSEIVLDPAFQKSITDDSLVFYISSLIPISKPAEIKNIVSLLKTKDKEMYRKYIQSYWVNSTSGLNVYDNWTNYKKQVLMVQRLFKTNIRDGFETDRGRVYLQYGPPSNVIVRENSPSDYPYEIWRYDKIKVYSNKRFIFYNPDLVNNNYSLLHSDMLGEVQNYRWQQQLAKRNSSNSNIDDPNDGNVKHFGGNSQELYNQY